MPCKRIGRHAFLIKSFKRILTSQSGVLANHSNAFCKRLIQNRTTYHICSRIGKKFTQFELWRDPNSIINISSKSHTLTRVVTIDGYKERDEIQRFLFYHEFYSRTSFRMKKWSTILLKMKYLKNETLIEKRGLVCPRLLILKLQQEVLNFNDICMSWSLPKFEPLVFLDRNYLRKYLTFLYLLTYYFLK